MTELDIFGLVIMAVLFVCMVPALYTSFKALNMNEKLVGQVLEDNLASEKKTYEDIWNELNYLPIQTWHVEKLKEKYQKKIVEIEDVQRLNSTTHEKVHKKYVHKNYNTF